MSRRVYFYLLYIKYYWLIVSIQKESYERPQSLLLDSSISPGGAAPLPAVADSGTNQTMTNNDNNSSTRTSRLLLNLSDDLSRNASSGLQSMPPWGPAPPGSRVDTSSGANLRLARLQEMQREILASGGVQTTASGTSTVGSSSHMVHRTSYDSSAATGSLLPGVGGVTTTSVPPTTPKSAPASATMTSSREPTSVRGSDTDVIRFPPSSSSSSVSPPITPQHTEVLIGGTAGAGTPHGGGFLPQLLDMGFSLRHVQAAIAALGNSCILHLIKCPKTNLSCYVLWFCFLSFAAYADVIKNM